MLKGFVTVLLVGAVATVGCVGMEEQVGGDGQDVKVNQAPMLNLSHIACAEDGTVTAHFVLLFNGASTPGTLSGTYNGGTFGPVSSYKTSGNVWHYNVTLPSGDIDITSAQVTASNGTVVYLHNPDAYSGNYDCGGGNDGPSCSVSVEPTSLLCLDTPLGNPGSECGYFGLLVIGKDDNLTGLTWTATTDAYVAIVKSGIGACNPGQSAYAVYTNVTAGEVLNTPTGDQAISHVTYCACPDNQAP